MENIFRETDTLLYSIKTPRCCCISSHINELMDSLIECNFNFYVKFG